MEFATELDVHSVIAFGQNIQKHERNFFNKIPLHVIRYSLQVQWHNIHQAQQVPLRTETTCVKYPYV